MPLSRLTPETAFHFPANNKIQGAAFGRAETPSILQICLFSDAAVVWSRNYAADENLLEYIGFFYLIGRTTLGKARGYRTVANTEPRVLRSKLDRSQAAATVGGTSQVQFLHDQPSKVLSSFARGHCYPLIPVD